MIEWRLSVTTECLHKVGQSKFICRFAFEWNSDPPIPFHPTVVNRLSRLNNKRNDRRIHSCSQNFCIVPALLDHWKMPTFKCSSTQKKFNILQTNLPNREQILTGFGTLVFWPPSVKVSHSDGYIVKFYLTEFSSLGVKKQQQDKTRNRLFVIVMKVQIFILTAWRIF